MKLELQNFIRKLRAIGSLAFNLVQFIAAAIALIATSAGAAFVANIIHLQNWIIPLVAFASGIFITLLLVVLFFLRTTPPRWIVKGYRYVRTESLYTIHEDDPTHHTFTVTIELEAIKSGVSIFEDRYRWTGHGREEGPIVVSHGHSLMGEIIKQSGWKYYYVHLGHVLNEGERTEIIIKQELYDIENKFEPFLARTIAEPVDQLILRVALPKNRISSNIVFNEWNTGGPASTIIRKTPGQMNHQTGEICWNVQSPIFGHRYEIRWGH